MRPETIMHANPCHHRHLPCANRVAWPLDAALSGASMALKLGNMRKPA